ncbi:helix-turn-helix domain-containing protein [Lactiplantibacillus sp. WILCCON 0030]|uniref:Helix-turn-helix domain-containing protein n=1 Tax=Lactiplantibacillus brownii TaxID=3069269 RepID=A0ABU1A8A8_9LACO|nr:helix-turn-helix domain-containing protein [Lactiplantibacillus brownii]MDQ7936682.1 helix-turn-helix domain-containing protein [Lactiplantibacillus brownii]
MYANEFDATMQMIRGKWKILILYELADGDGRFNQLQRTLSVTHKILAEQLQQLMTDGLVQRHDFHEQPLHVAYQLSQKGQSMIPVLDTICDWGLAHVDRDQLTSVLCDETE